MRIVEKLNNTLHELMNENNDLFIIGEDILDPYGGAFKVTKGLSTKFPERVITTPISEGSIVGFSTGLAMSNKKVIVEIMFGDFLTLAFDQIINHISKFIWVDNNIKLPIIIRTPMGGGRGYGSTHSQSIEKHFCGISGIKVLCINQFSNLKKIYSEALNSNMPTLIIENKILYGKQFLNNPILQNKKNPDIICVTYGGSIETCIQSAEETYKEDEIDTEIYPIEKLSPFDYSEISKLTKKCKKFLFVEESGSGWGFNDICKASLAGIDGIKFETISGSDHPIPSSKEWELNLMPNKERISRKLRELFSL